MKKPRNPSERGVALVLVLAFIVLLSGMLVAFLSTAGNSRRAAGQYEAEVSLGQLAETATNVVMGQIIDGTRSWEVPPATGVEPSSSADRLTYSTQPGLIRTYDSKGHVGRAFKLYSSDTMVTPEGSEWVVTNELGKEVPSNWVVNSAQFVDLNAPVLVPDASGDISMSGGSQRYLANYPIVDPSALSPTGRVAGASSVQDGVEGFDLNNVPGYGGPGSGGRPQVKAGYNPVETPSPGTSGNPAPMPVRWLYVLQNGTLTSPDPASSSGTTASWANLPAASPNKPSKSNPIVGRIAFWTDDDTAKLNPNVHSEGIAWDRPYARGSNTNSPYTEDQLRDRQPVREEYQRYPGHPATVCLSTILGIIPEYRVPTGDNVSSSDYANSLRKYYDLTPYIGTGGSMGGTAMTYDRDAPPTEMARDSDRLFATPDELAFVPARSGTPFVKRQDLEKAKFFVTTQARSAEVTLLNQPRISLWMPQQEKDPNGGKAGSPQRPRTAKDELLAFCGTVGGKPYFFQRNSIFLRRPVSDRSAHSSIPFNQLPQFGYVAPSSQQPSLDWSVGRNEDMYAYLQRLTATELPGFGGKLTDRYTADQRNQILTEMVDLLRLSNGYSIDPKVTPNFEYAPPRKAPDAVSGETQIVPLVPPSTSAGGNTKGFGRFPTVTEAMLIFHAAGPNATPQDPDLPTSKMRVVLALEPFTPNAGSWTYSPLVRYVVKGLEKISINGQPNRFRLPGPTESRGLSNLVTSRCGYQSGGNHNTAHTGTFAAFRYWIGSSKDETKKIPATGAVATDEEKDYPYVSNEITLPKPPPDKMFDFAVTGDGIITVEIHTGYATAPTDDTLVQTIKLRYPPVRLPLPRDSGADRQFQNRIGPDKFSLVNSNDTVRSMEVDPNGPTRGDLRLVAAMRNVPPEVYAGYAGGVDGSGYASNATIVHSFRNGDGGTVTGGKIQSALLPNGTRGNYIAARGMNGAMIGTTLVGDWDNGPGGFIDGAYINKPDDYYGSNQGDWYDAPTNTPNRQISSGVVFGSLPTGATPAGLQPWRTLVFSPNPAAGKMHPALTANFSPTNRRVRDHLFLDFFTMPIVEPFAISEPLSSLGKVNLNYQLAPFSYMTRATALHGVLKSTRICAIPTGASHKGAGGMYRLAIDATETLKGFEDRFKDPAKGGAFRSASEICDMYLVPKGSSITQVRDGTWWNAYGNTGDNAREAPYGQIYARVTTKSNTFTVHARVQTLRKRPGGQDDWDVWREGVDHVSGEQRSSQTIERYVDLADKSLEKVDFAKTPSATLDNYYKFRVIQTKRFNP